MSIIGRKRLLSITIRNSLFFGYPIIDMKIKRSYIESLTSFIPIDSIFVPIYTNYYHETKTYTRKFYDIMLFNNELNRLRSKYPETVIIKE
jgi:hypothetical protein